MSYKYHQTLQATTVCPKTEVHSVASIQTVANSKIHDNNSIIVPEDMDRSEANYSNLSQREDISMNYNNYATKKTIGHGCLTFSLITSNAMQIRTLSRQKQRDGLWSVSLLLIIFSLLAQITLAGLLIIVGKGNIQDPYKQKRLQRFNNLALFITVLIAMDNVIINVFMSTTDSKHYLDEATLELLKYNT